MKKKDFFSDLQKKIDNVSGKIKFEDLFNSKFMQTNTNFNNIEQFFESSPFTVNTEDDFDNLNENELDGYVKEKTKFASWEEMKVKAAEIYVAKELNLK